MQMRENYVQVNNIANQIGGVQNLTVDDIELPLTLETDLLHLPVRKPTNEFTQVPNHITYFI